jgi:hypothetical protein
LLLSISASSSLPQLRGHQANFALIVSIYQNEALIARKRFLLLILQSGTVRKRCKKGVNLTHPGGRPRTVSLPPEDMIALGEEMIKWVKLHDPYHLSQWYCGEKSIPFSDWETMRKRFEFVTYYEKAMLLIGAKYIRKDSEIEPSLKHRFLRLYFKDLRHQEDNDAKANALLSKFVEQPQDLKDLESKLDALSAQLSPSIRNIDDSNTINDK